MAIRRASTGRAAMHAFRMPRRWRSPIDRRFEEAGEFASEIDGDARMHGTLLVEETLSAAQPEHALVPDVGVDVQPSAPVEAEADETLRRQGWPS